MNKVLAAVTVVLVAVFGLGTTATAQGYPPAAATVTAPSTVQPGASFTVVVNGCRLGEAVDVTLSGATATITVRRESCAGAGGTGRFVMQVVGGTATATLTAPTAAGTYTITATGLESGFTATTSVTVVAQTTTTSGAGTGGGGGGGGLPTTGSDSSPTLWIGGTALVVGAGLLAVGWKRRRPAAS